MDPITGNAALKVGGTLLGGVLGRSKGPSLRKQLRQNRDHMRKVETQRYKWLVSGAQAAGFNPSSALGATGGNFGNAQNMSASPMSNGMGVIGDAIRVFADEMDPVRLETQRLNNEILEEQLTRYRETPKAPISGGTVPGVQKTRSPVEDGRPAIKTNFGDEIPVSDRDAAAIAARTDDVGLGNAFDLISTPEWWPTAGYMEEQFADDSWVTNIHRTMTPWVVAYNNWDDLKDFARGLRGSGDESFEPKPVGNPAPGKKGAPRKSGSSQNRRKNRTQ